MLRVVNKEEDSGHHLQQRGDAMPSIPEHLQLSGKGLNIRLFYQLIRFQELANVAVPRDHPTAIPIAVNWIVAPQPRVVGVGVLYE
jgi:hypothetical protein